MLTKNVSLANASLLLIGASRIASFDEESSEAVTVNEFYERSYQYLISLYPWHFASKTITLSRLPEVPAQEYQYKYRLPSDLIRVQRVFPNVSSYKILNDELHADYKDLSLKYQYRAPEEYMPIYFEQAMVYYLASQICITLTEDTQRAAVLAGLADTHIKKAKSLDAQSQPQDGFEDFPIDDVRYS